MSIGLPFSPISTVSVVTSGTAQRLELPASSAASTVRVVGSNFCLFKLGDSSVDATTGGIPVAGVPLVLDKGNATHVSVIAFTGTPTFWATTGVGGA